jgi:hypothetical protein
VYTKKEKNEKIAVFFLEGGQERICGDGETRVEG